MGIFSTSNLLEANFAKPTNVQKINVEESYFVAALNYIEEFNRDMSSSTKVLYKSILEAGDDLVAINESFSSFCQSIKKIIEKFLEFLKRIVQKFILALNKMVKSEKYITKHKADIKKLNSNDTFKMDVFIFTHLTDDEIPMLDPQNDWKGSEGFAAPNATDALLTRVTNVYNDTKKNLDGGWYDSFRGRVIKKGNGISVDDFGGELFEVFRNNSKDKTEVEFSYDKVIDALNRFEGHGTNVKHVQDLKRVMEKGYGDIKKEIEDWSKAGTDGRAPFNGFIGDTNREDYNSHKKEIDEQLDLFIKAKVAQVDHMCKIHAMAFTAKLDAIKACFNQDKAILYKALSKVKTIKAHKESYELDEDGEGEPLYELL